METLILPISETAKIKAKVIKLSEAIASNPWTYVALHFAIVTTFALLIL